MQFKLIQKDPDSLARLVTFHDAPTWEVLSNRIEELYGIPARRVGVAYMDRQVKDRRDEITISTNQELQEYYTTIPPVSTHAIKFTVRILGVPRPRSTATAKVPLFDMADEEWQRVPLSVFTPTGYPLPHDDAVNPHRSSTAYVETVEDEVEARGDDQPSSSESEPEQLHGDEGFFNVEGDEDKHSKHDVDSVASSYSAASSVVSVLNNNLPDKQPVHVYDFDGDRRKPAVSERPEDPATPIIVYHHSPAPVEDLSAENPPLTSTFGTAPAPAPTPAPSLTNDVATLLTALTDAFNTHSELSEGLRNIVHNASQGVYWNNAQEMRDTLINDALDARDTVMREVAQARDSVMNDAARTVEGVASQAHDEAGRRVAEALGGIFRALGSAIGSGSFVT
ncbi:hypothetical protein BU17DRAFT_50673, partial [Hysterangium stoloniferum]